MALSRAIAERRVIEFTYDGLHRIVIPAALGHHVTTGRLLLRGYQTGGASKSRVPPLWDLYSVSKVLGLVITDQMFADNPPDYRRGDAYLRIISQL